MLSSVALSFRSPTPPSPPPPPPDTNRHPLQTPNSHALSSATANSAASTSMPEKPKARASPQLSRWSRARAIRSGRKLDRQGKVFAAVTANPSRPVETTEMEGLSDVSDSSGEEEEAVVVGGKAIYMVSDGTGWTVEHSVNAALGQFEHCLIDRACAINTHLFSGIEEVDRLLEVVKQAAKEGAVLVYTLADPSMTGAARSACKIWNVPSIDMLGPITDAIASHLGVTPSGLPRNAPGRNHLTEEYFRRIEAIEFTIKQDDGALPQNLKKADIVLAGVSRTGKTPLSIYLAQKGYKVANVPIVMGIDLPSTLFEVSPRKVFGLTINPVMLQAIRRARSKTLGFGDEARCNYSEMDYVREELEHARKIFARNPTWPVIEVTGKAIEETAAVVLRLYHDRKQKCSMPRISKRY